MVTTRSKRRPARARGPLRGSTTRAARRACRQDELAEDAFAGKPLPGRGPPWFAGGDEDRSEAARVISTARLHVLPRLHLPPIDVLVWNDPYPFSGWETSSCGGLRA